jgi:hypothetical protein
MMKELVVSQSGFGASIFSAPSFLRIAIPSWRSIGIQYRAAPEPESTSLSREEIQALFQGELSPKAKPRNPLTEAEEREKSLADRMRQALYPAQEH